MWNNFKIEFVIKWCEIRLKYSVKLKKGVFFVLGRWGGGCKG